MSKSVTLIQLLQARLERAMRWRRENPSRTDILMIPALALALDACGGGGSQRPTPPLYQKRNRLNSLANVKGHMEVLLV